jgi:hypothetical protein
MEVKEDVARDRTLHVAVELAPGAQASGARASLVADAIAGVLRRLNASSRGRRSGSGRR